MGLNGNADKTRKKGSGWEKRRQILNAVKAGLRHQVLHLSREDEKKDAGKEMEAYLYSVFARSIISLNI